MSTHIRLRSDEVVHETLDAETIIIDLKTGSYYSVNDLGSVVFLRAVSGLSRAEICEQVAAAYPDAEKAAIEVDGLIEQFVKSDVCVLATAEEVADVVDVTENRALPASYTTAWLDGYDDLSDLLLLDPIHEVDESAGWPAAKSDD